MKSDFRTAADRDVWVQFFALLFIISGVFTLHYLVRGRQPARAVKQQEAKPAAGQAAIPRTKGRWVVSRVKSGDADASTLAEAVAAARDGDSIILRPGTYSESVLVTKSVSIAGGGDSPNEVTLTWSKGETLIVGGGSVALANLTLENRGLANYWALDVSDAILSVRRVKLSSSGSGMRVRDAEAHISDSALAGRRALFVTGRSRVGVARSSLSGEEAGISADGGEVNLSVEKCSLKNGHGTGLAAARFASVTVDGTTISGNALAAVSVYDGAHVKITGSVIHGNKECALILDSGGQAILERTRVSNNKCGAGFSGPGLLEARDSTFTNLRMGAVAIKEGFEDAVNIRGGGNTGLTIPYRK